MEIKEYIESGILEQYVLGQLSLAKAKEVEDMCKNHAEIAQEVQELSIMFERYATEHAVSPDASVKSNLMNELFEEEIVSTSRNNSNTLFKGIAVAASILLVVSIGFNIVQQSKIKDQDQRIKTLYAEQEVLAEQNDQYKTTLEENENKLNLYRNTDIQRIRINGSDLSPESFAIVHWNQTTKKAFLSNVNLPKPDLKMQYQLWAIVDGTPVDLGVFNLENGEIEITKEIENPSAFAVTLEEEGGKPSPNLEQLYLIGNV